MSAHRHVISVLITVDTDDRLSETTRKVRDAVKRQFDGDHTITISVVDADCLGAS